MQVDSGDKSPQGHSTSYIANEQLKQRKAMRPEGEGRALVTVLTHSMTIHSHSDRITGRGGVGRGTAALRPLLSIHLIGPLPAAAGVFLRTNTVRRHSMKVSQPSPAQPPLFCNSHTQNTPCSPGHIVTVFGRRYRRCSGGWIHGGRGVGRGS